MKFWMMVRPALSNRAKPAGLVQFYDLALWQAEHYSQSAPETEEQAREICARWCVANNKWVYEYAGSGEDPRFQLTFLWEEVRGE